MYSFNYDNSKSLICEEFLENNFLSKFNLNYEFITDKILQKKGVDLILNNKKIDLKSSIYYLNQELKTFAFEIAYNENKDLNGWFISNDFNETEKYFITYPKSKKSLNNVKHYSDIDEMELLMIDKKNLKESLKDIIEIIKTNVVNHITNKENKFYHNPKTQNDIFTIPFEDIKLVIVKNNKLKEKPYNLLLPKDYLIKLSECHIKIYNNKVIKLKTKI